MSLDVSKYQDYDIHTFELNGREGVLICPEGVKEGNPYIWRTEFLGAFDFVDQEMLRRGWCLAYYRISDMYGAPQAVRLMREFQTYLEQTFHLAKKAVLLGFSRGGLYAVNYTAKYPNKVDKLYLDAPVLDIFSWPKGHMRGKFASKEWEECKALYGVKDGELDTPENPLHKINTLIANDIPVILVAGDCDEVVPLRENGLILYAQYMANQGNIKLIVKHGVGHHPHSMEDPEEIADFLVQQRVGCFIENGAVNWEIWQHSEGTASRTLTGTFAVQPDDTQAVPYIRAVREACGTVVVPWTPCQVEQNRWRAELTLPLGGLYRIETCLTSNPNCKEWARRGDIVHHIGVGDVYIIAGQSNAVGYGKDSFTDAPELGVHLLKQSGRWDVAAHPFQDATHSVHTQNMDGANTGNGPYLSFGRYLKKLLGYPIGFIPCALGGSGIDRWDRNRPGSLYWNMLHIVKNSTGGSVKGLLWYQGCTDAGEPAKAESYLDHFKALVQNIRQDLDVPELPVLTFQINRALGASTPELDKGWGKVREAQRQAAMQLKNVWVLPTTDCKLSDNIHISAVSQAMLGERLAKNALYHLYGKQEFHGWDAPNLIRVQQIDTHTVVATFAAVSGRLITFDVLPEELPIKLEKEGKRFDAAGYEVVDGYKLKLTFPVEVTPECTLHGAYRKSLVGTVPEDFATHMPMLSFYGVPLS